MLEIALGLSLHPKLYALLGALQGVRWHSLDDTVKKDLKLFYNSIEKTEKDV